MHEIDRIASHESSRNRMYISPSAILDVYPALGAQIEAHPIEPAIALLRQRRATNGWADIWDLAEVLGVDLADGAESVAFAVRLSAVTDIRIEPGIGDEPTKYRIAVGS